MNQQEQDQYNQYKDPYQNMYQEPYDATFQGTYTQDNTVDLQRVMTKTYLGMFGLLFLSAAAALLTINTSLFWLICTNTRTFGGCMIAELVIAIAATRAVRKNNFALSALLTILYSIMSGITFSVVLAYYARESVTSIFVLAALLFLGVALFGTFTKIDLTGIGQIGLMALWGIILIGLANLFFRSYMVSTWLAAAGLIIFIGITAYDTQKIKDIASESSIRYHYSENTLAVYGAFTLYLDFINIFLHLLQLFGRRD